MTTDLTLPGASPFDGIRHGEGDLARWSARDLLPLLGYGSWQTFRVPLERAARAAENQGHDVAHHFMRSHKVTPSGPPAEDFILTRFAAYLVAMNGDPNKPEVAAAQGYFAIRTREAETAAPALPDITTPAGVLAMAEQFAATARQLVASTQRIAELEPRAEVADRLLDADGDLSVADAAKALTRAGIDTGATRLFKALERLCWIYRGRSDGRWHVYQAAIEARYMAVIPQSHFHPSTGELVMDAPQPRVTPKGLERLMRELTSATDLRLVTA